MSSNKKNHYLVIKFFIIFFSLIFPLKALEIKIVDGDTIHINKDKIRFSGIDAPELNQTCLLNNNVVNCGKISKELLIKKRFPFLGGVFYSKENEYTYIPQAQFRKVCLPKIRIQMGTYIYIMNRFRSCSEEVIL